VSFNKTLEWGKLAEVIGVDFGSSVSTEYSVSEALMHGRVGFYAGLGSQVLALTSIEFKDEWR
jgi:hypothetical protein